MTYVYCRNKDTSRCAHHLRGVRGTQQHPDFSRVFSFSASAVLPSQREQIGASATTSGWAELRLLILRIHGPEPLATAELNRWVQTRCNCGTVSSATGRHSLTRGQEEMWNLSPLRSRIHYFFLQTLFSSSIFSASTETLMLSSPATQLFPHYHHQLLSRKLLY